MKTKPDFDFSKAVKSWNDLIKAGKIDVVKQQLFALSHFKNIPRKFICELATVAKRVHLHLLVLKWLRPFVIQDQSLQNDATSEEIALFTSALMRNGSFTEARMILDVSLEPSHTQILLSRSHLEIFQWNYSDAIPILKKYLAKKDLSDYSIRIGCLNLAAAYVAEQDWINARPLLEELRRAATKDQQWLIYANTLELSAQSYIQTGQLSLARHELTLASETLDNTGGTYDFLIRKWTTILQALEQKNLNDGLQILESLKLESISRKDFETARECDLYSATISRNINTYFKVYFGTKHKGYISRIKRIFKPDFVTPLRWTFKTSFPIDQNTPLINLETGVTSLTNLNFRKNSLFLRSLQTLFSDLYSPQVSIGALMNSLYPGEFFNPYSSPGRIFKVINRLRHVLEQNKIPIKIILNNGYYSAVVHGPVNIVLFKRKTLKPSFDLRLVKFLSEFNQATFSTLDFASSTQLKLKTAQRILSEAAHEKALLVDNRSRPHRYRVA